MRWLRRLVRAVESVLEQKRAARLAEARRRRLRAVLDANHHDTSSFGGSDAGGSHGHH